MDVSELRKRILHAIDVARRETAARQRQTDLVARAFEAFLADIAVPLLRQAAQVLNAAGESFAVETPAGRVRLSSNRSADTFVELVLDSGASGPEVIGRVGVAKGRQGVILEERAIAPGKPVTQLTEADVAAYLVDEIPKLVVKQ